MFENRYLIVFYDFLDQNCLLNTNQSGFRPGDSSMNQITAITHNIFTAFDANWSLEVHGIFLDLSKALDRVWHKDLIHKLKNNGIDGKLLSLIESFLHNRYQRVVLNGQSSKWQNVNADVAQGSVLGPLFSSVFADDTSLFSVTHDVDASSATLNNDLVKIQEWAYN